jgi:hypothetical protein
LTANAKLKVPNDARGAILPGVERLKNTGFAQDQQQPLEKISLCVEAVSSAST